MHRLFTEIAPDMAEREGGYTRITKIGARKGDNAPMVVIELVRERVSAKKATVKEAEAATKRAAKAAPAPAPVEVEDEVVEDVQDAPVAEADGAPDDAPVEAAESVEAVEAKDDAEDK